MSNPNPQEVERLVECLMGGVKQFGQFEGPDGVSAVFTFAKRFITAMLEHTPKESRWSNAEKIAGGLRTMASLIEFEEMEAKNLKVH